MTSCEQMRNEKAEVHGNRTRTSNEAKSIIAAQGGAESGALVADNDDRDLDLNSVIKAWPALPEALRRAVLAIVETYPKSFHP